MNQERLTTEAKPLTWSCWFLLLMSRTLEFPYLQSCGLAVRRTRRNLLTLLNLIQNEGLLPLWCRDYSNNSMFSRLFSLLRLSIIAKFIARLSQRWQSSEPFSRINYISFYIHYSARRERAKEALSAFMTRSIMGFFVWGVFAQSHRLSVWLARQNKVENLQQP